MEGFTGRSKPLAGMGRQARATNEGKFSQIDEAFMFLGEVTDKGPRHGSLHQQLSPSYKTSQEQKLFRIVQIDVNLMAVSILCVDLAARNGFRLVGAESVIEIDFYEGKGSKWS